MAKEEFKYIIKNKAWNLYLQRGEEKIYTPLFNNSIHDKVPSWISENEPHLEIIRSDSENFKDLTKHLNLEEN